MKKVWRFTFLVGVLFFLATAFFFKFGSNMPMNKSIDSQKALNTMEQKAELLSRKAAQYLRDNGAQAAASEFNKSESDFANGEFYVFMFTKEGVVLAHPIFPKLAGENIRKIVDSSLIESLVRIISVEKEEWVEYPWRHPITKELRDKKSYIINVDGYVVGAGAYSD